MKKKGLKYYLSLFAAACGIVYMLLRITGILQSRFHAYAATDIVTLTEQQTLALYGTTISGSYYAGDPYDASDPAGYLPITFHYAFPLSSIGYMETGGGFSGNSLSDFSPAQINNDIRYLRGLVYIADASQWNYGYFPTNNSVLHNDNYNTNPLYNLELPMNISISGLTDIVQYIGWSTSYFSLGQMYALERNGYNSSDAAYYAYRDNNRAVANYCDWELLTNTLVNPSGKALESPTVSNIDGNRVTGFKQIPFYPFYASDDPIDESQIARFSFFRVSGGAASGDSFNVNGIRLGLQNLSPLYSHLNSRNSTPPDGGIAIIIGCPKIYDYVPSIETTVPAQTTAPSTVTTSLPVPVTMPTDVTDIPLSVINDNLRIIINQLNQIYLKISGSGALTADQLRQLLECERNDADPLHTLDSGVLDVMHRGLTHYTTPQIPDSGNGFELIHTLYDKFSSGPFEILGMIGAFSLAMFVLSWFLFRGRGG